MINLLPRGVVRVLACLTAVLVQIQILLAGSSAGSTIQYGHEVWDANRGFPAFSISAITQTPDGYLWLGTDEGLVRFDGVRFTLFNTSNTPGIKHNNISALCVQRDSTLWIATNGGGLSKLRHHQFTAYTAGDGLPENTLLSLARGSDNQLWIGTASSGLVRMRDSTFYPSSDPRQPRGLPIFSLHGDINGVLKAGIGNTLSIKFPGVDSMRSMQSTSTLLLSICELRNGTTLLGAADGVFMYEGREVRNFPIKEVAAIKSVRAIVEDHEGSLWFCTEGMGLFRYSQGVLTKLTASDGVLTDRILCMYEDRELNLWVGTRGGGLLRLKRSVVTTLATSGAMLRDQIAAVFEDRNNNLWIGTRDSGVCVVRNTKGMDCYLSNKGKAGSYVRAIFEDSSGNIWIGTQAGLHVIRKSRNGVTLEELTADGMPILSVRVVLEDRHGTIWIGSSSDGVFLSKRDSKTISKLSGQLPGEYLPVRTMLEDRQGRIWVGTRAGLAVIDDEVMTRFSSGNNARLREVFSFHEDEQGALWIGTYGEGLFRLKDQVLTRYTKQQGLFDNVVYTILDDGNGYFWMSCNKGIFRVNKRELDELAEGRLASLSSTSFGTADGMQSIECNGGSQPSGWKTGQGMLLFPTMKGIAVIDPRFIHDAGVAPSPIIEDLIVNDSEVQLQSAIVLPAGNRRFEARFTGLSLVLSDKIQFRYKLEGFDDNWVETGTIRSANFTNIPPGAYVFKVSARRPGQEWTSEAAAVAITVLPFFWETTWFKFLVSMLLLGLIFVSARYYSTRALRQRLRELEAQRALDQERARISKDMHDEVGASLTQIAILSELLGRNLEDRAAVESYLKNISTTAQEVVGSLDEIVWFINPRHDTLESLMLYLREYLANYFEPIDIACRFDFPEQFPLLTLAADTRRSIFLVAKEAANNIAKHAHAHTVAVSATLEKGVLTLSIHDDGCGIPSEHLSAFGNGLKNKQKRMEEIGGTFGIAAVHGKGTRVNITAKITSQK